MKKYLLLFLFAILMLSVMLCLSSCSRCVECDGSGYIACPDCDGKNFTYDPTLDVYVVCNRAVREGKIKCPNCMNWVNNEIKDIPNDLGITE